MMFYSDLITSSDRDYAFLMVSISASKQTTKPEYAGGASRSWQKIPSLKVNSFQSESHNYGNSNMAWTHLLASTLN